MLLNNLKSMMLAAVIAVAGICHAQTSVNIGYCAGEVSDKGALTVEGNTWVSGAIYLPSTMLQPYDGLQITTMRAGLASRLNLDSLRVWVRTELDGPNLGEGVITNKSTPKIKSGWNEVALEAPVGITSQNGLYLGFSYHQKTQTGAFSAVGSELPNAFFAQLSPAEAWQDMSSLGILSVEATVEGAELPDYDLSLTSAAARPSSVSAQYHLDVSVSNVGQKAVSGFSISTYTSADQAAQGYSLHLDCDLATGSRQTFGFDVPEEYITDKDYVFVSITSIDEGEDAVAENNTVKAQFAYVRKVVIEEFTTERCSNCPRVAAQLHTVLEDPKYADNVIAVCHHAGYYVDSFTQDCDNELVAANAYSVGYAPAMMFDRAPIFNGAFHVSPDREIILSGIDARLATETHASLSFNATFNPETSHLNVEVTGERNAVFTNKSTHLTVYVTEDNVKAVYQSGADDPLNFYHQHVIRAYNSTWGDEIVWDVNSFKMDYSFPIDPDWKYSDMKIVAFVSSYDDSNLNDCVIENAEVLSLTDVESGIGEILIDGNAPSVKYYHLDGTAINGRPSDAGFYIEVSNRKARVIKL